MGFSLIEVMMVLVIIATVVGALLPSVVKQIGHARVNRATRVIASDFYLAQSTASRNHKPVLIAIDSAARTVTLSDASTATPIVVRQFGISTEFKLLQLYSIPASVVIFPSGMGSASAAIVVGDASYSRNVTISRAGQIRIQ